MTDLALGVVVLVGVGVLPALALVRRPVAALLVAPLCTGAMAWFAVMVGMQLRISSTVMFPTVFGLGSATAALVLLPRRRPRLEWSSFLDDLGVAIFALVGCMLPALALRRAPVDWDARSIWFFHAEWFHVGGARAVAAAVNPAFAFAHPDYPGFIPSTSASVWFVSGRATYEMAQMVTGLVVIAGVCSLVLAVARAARRGSSHQAVLARPVLLAGSALLSFALFGIGARMSFNGYVDFVWAVLLAAGSVTLLASRGSVSRSDLVLAVVLLLAAGTTKNEASTAATFVCVYGLVRFRRQLPRVFVLLVPIAFAAVWSYEFRHFGAPATFSGGHVARAFTWTGLSRIPAALGSFAHWIWDLLAVAFVVLALGGARLQRARLRAGLATSAPLLSIAAFTLLEVMVAFMSSPNQDRYLPIAHRTTMAAAVLLLVDVCLSGWAVVVALSARSAPLERPGTDGSRSQAARAGDDPRGAGPSLASADTC